MKKLFITAAAVLSLTLCNAQTAAEMMAEIKDKYTLDDNGRVTYTKVIDVPGMKKEDVYNRAQSYFVYNYVDGKSTIQTQDKEAGLLLAKGIYPDVHVGISLVTTYVDCSHIVRVDCKDDKARVIVTLIDYEKKIVGGSTPPSYITVPVNKQYPIFNGGGQKTVMTKAFYKSHMKALETIEKIEKSIIEGNTSKNLENGGW
jgi:hypothetical protein